MTVPGETVVEPDEDDIPTLLPPAAAPPPAPPPVPVAVPPAVPIAEDKDTQIERLTAAVRRNNGELAKRRTLGNWMKKLGIDDLEGWLAGIGVDPSTGQPMAPPAAVTVEPELEEDGPTDLDLGLGPAPAAPAAAPTGPGRQALLEAQREATQNQERADALAQALRDARLAAALEKARFSGTFDKALWVMDLSEVTVEDDGTVSGVDEAVQGLREEIPEWFRGSPATRPPGETPPPPRRITGANDAGDKRTAPPRPANWEDRLVSRWRRGR